MPKKNANGVPETFKIFIQKSKFEREIRRHVFRKRHGKPYSSIFRS
jgi:hypothetical protein